MILLTLATSAVIATGAPAAHETAVEHRGATYRVLYQPQVTTRTKTVGMSVGTRPSTERCRWEAVVTVERQVRRGDVAEGLAKQLPGTHMISDSHPGSCAQARTAIADAVAGKTDRIRAHVAQVAQADRGTVLADIDAAHALALN